MSSPVIEARPAWQDAYPTAAVGVLLLDGVANPASHPDITALADELERDLRTRFGGQDRATLWATPPLPAYAAYFKRFGERYHVARQLESVATKGRPIPRAAALVTAMFVAELRHLVVVAGHDLAEVALPLPLRLDLGTGTEEFTTAQDKPTAVKAGDMYVADAVGPLSAVVAGPASRARLRPATTAACFVAYAPPGVPAAAVAALLDEISASARLISPAATTTARAIVVAPDSVSPPRPVPP